MVIGAMVDLVREIDPLFFEKVGLATARADGAAGSGVSRARAAAATRSRAEFDARLGGRVVAAARLVGRRRGASSPTPCAPPSA